jgi:hypothetical protein
MPDTITFVEASIDAVRIASSQRGYKLLPIAGIHMNVKHPGKQPVDLDWRQKFARHFDEQSIRGWLRQSPDCTNTGLITGISGGIVAADIDVLIPEAAAEITDLATELLGVTPLRRIGKAPKILLVYGVSDDFRKVKTPEFKMQDGSKGQVEFLAEGQQFVGYGLHPETKQPYQWIDKSPADVSVDDLPIVDRVAAETFIEAATQVLRSHGGVIQESKKRKAKAAASPHPTKKAENGTAPIGDNFFKNVNSYALSHLEPWINVVFDNKARLHRTGAWRIRSDDLGRDLEEDISFHPEGGYDFGLEEPISPIDSVIEYGGAPDPVDAAHWLCRTIGVDPATLGWSERKAKEAPQQKAPEEPTADKDQSGGAEEKPEDHDPDLDDPLFPADPGPLTAETVQPDEYLIGKRLAKAHLSLLVAPGAVGKTILQLLQCVAFVTGRRLTGEEIHKPRDSDKTPRKAWFISNEENISVLRRRLWAICLHHKIDYEKEVRPFLYLNSTVNQETAFQVVELSDKTLMVSPDVEKVKRFAKKAGVDLMNVDPFISTLGGINENDNSAIDFAARQYAHIAASVPMAVELSHHISKSEDPEAHVRNIFKARGASALANKVKYSYTVAKTNDGTAEKYNLTPDERKRIIRLDMSDKNNYTLGDDTQWFYLHSVQLPNAQDGLPADNIGVPMLYDMNQRVTETEADAKNREEQELLLAAIEAACQVGDTPLTTLLPMVQELTKTQDRAARQKIAETIPEAPQKVVVTNNEGQQFTLWRRKSKPHSNAPIMVVKTPVE